MNRNSKASNLLQTLYGIFGNMVGQHCPKLPKSHFMGRDGDAPDYHVTMEMCPNFVENCSGEFTFVTGNKTHGINSKNART